MKTYIIDFFSKVYRFVKNLSKTKRWIFVVLCCLIIWYWFCLPSPLFKSPTCTIIEDSTCVLLGAHIAQDGQWRFPQSGKLPYKFQMSLILFEDQYFYKHPGINPASLFRAFKQNLSAGKTKSGGSTITMQVMRMANEHPSRSYLNKLIEAIQATRLEIKLSKDDILLTYASNAPFGSNVVGLEAASWRYFKRPPDMLSWAECAMLAVLPNSPSLIYPGKNHDKLRVKRNKLLKKLFDNHIIDQETYSLACLESLPDKPLPLPDIAKHVLDKFERERKGQRATTTLNYHKQIQVKGITEKHHDLLKANDVNNITAIVAEVATGKIIAYVGNISNLDKIHSPDVDVAQSARSTGSILKPFLYAAMLQEGKLLSGSLIADSPIQFGGFAPKNHDMNYDGAVPAQKALARSLNVPAVRLLNEYGIEKFHQLLTDIGISTINKPAAHYGLTMILGGAEAKLADLVGCYANMARILNNSNVISRVPITDIYFTKNKMQKNMSDQFPLNDPGSIYLTFDAMNEVNRPDEELNWNLYNSAQKIAWKTGTSFGNRDAWAVGITSKYVVGVWVGNADGEGRPELTGISSAAPVLFDIFKILEKSEWFKKPTAQMARLKICKASGFKASEICTETYNDYVQRNGEKTIICPYHQLVHTDTSGRYRVSSECASTYEMKHVSWFVLPPAMEWLYKKKHGNYQELPPYKPGCDISIKHLELMYPRKNSKIYIPKEISGKRGETIFRAAHRNPNALVYWHIDNYYIGSTRNLHEMAVTPEQGIHTLTVVDENGESVTQIFEITSSDN